MGVAEVVVDRERAPRLVDPRSTTANCRLHDGATNFPPFGWVDPSLPPGEPLRPYRSAEKRAEPARMPLLDRPADRRPGLMPTHPATCGQPFTGGKRVRNTNETPPP